MSSEQYTIKKTNMDLKAFELSLRFFQKIRGIEAIHLSLSQYSPLPKKEVLEAKHTDEGRILLTQHLDNLVCEGRIKDLNKPLMVTSVRNVLSNLRCVAFIRGYTVDSLAMVAEEVTDINIKRPYHVLGVKSDGRLTIEEYKPVYDNIENDFLWFISGAPVLWDESDEEDLFERIVTEASDYCHVWHIPRGNHPDATKESRQIWQDLQNIFLDTLKNSRHDAYLRLINYALKKRHLQREEHILHNVLGVDNVGNIYQLITTGRLENLGKQLKEQGARRAIVVDNSGSLEVQFYPYGINGSGNQLIAAPNHRSKGTAYMVIELKNKAFSFLES